MILWSRLFGAIVFCLFAFFDALLQRKFVTIQYISLDETIQKTVCPKKKRMKFNSQQMKHCYNILYG